MTPDRGSASDRGPPLRPIAAGRQQDDFHTLKTVDSWAPAEKDGGIVGDRRRRTNWLAEADARDGAGRTAEQKILPMMVCGFPASHRRLELKIDNEISAAAITLARSEPLMT